MKALSESSFLRYAAFSSLYVAQGLPEGLLLFAVPPWLVKHGLSAAEIGVFIGVLMLPWSFKLIHGPLMDRFSFLPMGRRRPWIVAAQSGLILSFLSFALIPDPVHNIGWLSAVAFLVSLFSSMQDVAVDGLAIDILPEDQQARANGLMWGSKTVGIAASTALSGWLINAYGLAPAVMTLAAVLCLIMMIPLFMRERPGERILPWTHGQTSPATLSIQLHRWRDIFRSLIRVFILPASLVMGAAALFNRMSEGLFTAAMPVLTVQGLDWSAEQYSQFAATAGLIAGLFGMLIGGALVDYVGKIRMMSITLVLFVVMNVLAGLLPGLWSNQPAMVAYLIGFFCLKVMLAVAIFATAMALCWKRVSATQFSLYMAISNFGYAAGSSVLGPISSLGYTVVFFGIAGGYAIMLLLLYFVDLKKHASRVALLDDQQSVVIAAVPELTLEPSVITR